MKYWVCPKCKQPILIHTDAGIYSFVYKGAELNSKWDECWFCPFCNKAWEKDDKGGLKSKS